MHINRKAFTLIELLVVVLIIGILAAIALPQYQKAVEKSRAVQLKTLVKNVAAAMEIYFLVNGEYPTRFDQLDISLDNGTTKPASAYFGFGISSNDAVRRFDDRNFEIVLNVNSGGGNAYTGAAGAIYAGKYKGGYINYYFKSNAFPLRQLICTEDQRANVFTLSAGDYCQKLMGFTVYKGAAHNDRYYTEN
jgi:prepilin-type N-terminal cleavage/methylation domain-containing protein